MYWTVDFLRSVDWNSPQVVLVTALLMILAVMRKWFLLAMSLLVITLGRGLCYLQLSREAMSDGALTLATVIYVTGGIVVISFAAVEFFVKE
jgi:hypothetical protein